MNLALMPRAYTPPPPPPPKPYVTKRFRVTVYATALRDAESRGCITVVNKMAGLSAMYLAGKDTARLPDELYKYDDDQKAKDWLFLVFTSSAARQITWKS